MHPRGNWHSGERTLCPDATARRRPLLWNASDAIGLPAAAEPQLIVSTGGFSITGMLQVARCLAGQYTGKPPSETPGVPKSWWLMQSPVWASQMRTW